MIPLVLLRLTMLAFLIAPYQPGSKVGTVSLDVLESRFRNGRDTTFVVNLWATWCKPCVAEVPWFENLHRRPDSLAPLKVILVSLDTPSDIQTVQRFVQRKGITAEVVVLNEGKPHKWIDRIDTTWSGAIPATLIVRKAGGQRTLFEQEFTDETLRSTIRTVHRMNP